MRTKTMSRLRFLGIIILLILALGFWYKATYSMEVVTNYSINEKSMSNSILLATQGSAFKDAIVANIVNQYKKDSIYVDIIDVSELDRVKHSNYDVIVILHTWEYSKPPAVVSRFIDKSLSEKNKLIVLATSGQGSNKIEGIDALVGESILENASDYSDEIIERIEKIIR